MVSPDITRPVEEVLTDSQAAIQAVKQPRPRANVALVCEIQHQLRALSTAGVQVRLNWIPGHAHIRGNERADILARNATMSPTVMLHLPLPRTAVNQHVLDYVRKLVEEDHRRQLAVQSSSTLCYQRTTALQPSPVSAATPRWLATAVSRLRLGYPCSWEIVERRERDCQHCGRNTEGALAHYLLECEHSRALRRGGPDTANMSRMEGAAAMARHVLDTLDTSADILLRHPPPR